MTISIIIPTLNMASTLHACLPSASNDVEVIVADGGSRDGTTDLAMANGWRVCTSPPGRARQMNAGAAIAAGDIFLFLHADTRLPEDFADHVCAILAEPNNIAGAFRLQIASAMRGIRLIERLANWRSVRWQMPYGDQALFLRAKDFEAVGGFPDLPIMEDVELVRHLRKRGRIRIAPAPVLTSARRWEEMGVWKTTVINQTCVAAYYLGVSPTLIHGWYYGAKVPCASFGVSACEAARVGGKEWSGKYGG
ncbi:MAG: TIGR04283 family arsenosugar biosynthesis glycosyltransferase [Acidobacteria bacterium]|nr:TIGR04283 family arsenosugar biosynthesis glycosyltransferase [Acidobacteriota bacterium]